MVIDYAEAILKYKSDYQLKKAIINKEIYKIEPGIYSDQEFVNNLQVLVKKYPNAVFTADSAYYYHNLTDVIPQYYFLATHRKAAKMMDKKVKQIYLPEDKYEIGISSMKVNGIEIRIYDKEKLLIELIKNSKKIPFDYYKEIINNYRRIIDELDMNKLSDYLGYYKNDIELFSKIQREVL